MTTIDPIRPPVAETWSSGLGTLRRGRLVLDRRRFLQLVAASGLAVAGTGTAYGAVSGQGAAPAAPPTSDPIADLAASLGHDLEAIFRFVQDEVRYEPYAGLLRGAKTTLLTRGGNSVDQAVLLAELLKSGGTPVRFAFGPIDAATAQELMTSTLVDADTARAVAQESAISERDLEQGIAWVTEDGPLSPDDVASFPSLQQIASAIDEGWADAQATAKAQLNQSLDHILAALAEAGIEIPVTATAIPQLEQRRHTWVQAGDGSEWIDLDPSIAGTGIGERRGEPGEPSDQLPDADRHGVTFRVIAESWINGALTPVPILEVAWFADQLQDTGMSFTHVPADAVSRGGVNLFGGAADGTLYNPVLFVESDAYVGERPVSIGGSGGGGDPFGGFLGGGGGEGLVEGETAAEWLEVIVSSPGADATVARRAIFDRVGPAARTSGALDPTTVPVAELVDLGDGIGPQYLPCRGVRAFRVSGGPVNAKAMVERVALRGVTGASLMAGGFELFRNIHGTDLAAPLGWRLFDTSPTVVSWDFGADSDGYRTSPDIWHRSFGAIELAAASPTFPPGVVAGVIPHVIERVSVGEPPDGTQPTAAELSVGAIFDLAAAQEIPTRVFQGTLPADTTYGADHRQLIQGALDAGSIVIVPERVIDIAGAPRLGWWLVDPASGATQDQRDDGRQTAEQIPTYTVVATALYRAGPFAMMTADYVATRYGPRIYAIWYEMYQGVQILQRVPP